MKKQILRLIKKLGYNIVRSDYISPDIEKEFLPIYDKCKDFTMTPIDRMYALYESIKYVVKNNIKGDFVECGVWKGGSCMLMAETLKLLGEERKIYLFDTFEGMTNPSKFDINCNNEKAKDIYTENWAKCSYNSVVDNLRTTNYNYFIPVKGDVKMTIPSGFIDRISILRLDTDFYDSTKHELGNLYPLLVKKGILIIDDFGYWKGARKATLEYFKNKKVFLNRVDSSCRLIIKQ